MTMQDRTSIASIVANPLGILPVEYKVLVKADPVSDTACEGRIIVPDTVRDKQQIAQERGVLVAIGGRSFEDFGEPKPIVGDRVLFNKFAGVIVHDAEDRNQSWRILNDKDINAILKEETC